MADPTLTPELYLQLMEGERKLGELPPLYDKAEACGIDCTPLRQIHSMQRERIDAIKQHFAPKNATRFE